MKTKRQTKMLELIKKHDIETQEELSDYLQKEGYQVTQATVSRDIRELKLTKVAMSNGRQKYAALTEAYEELSKIYPCFSGCFCVYGYGAEYSGDQNGFRNGNGSCGSDRCHASA